MKIGGFDLNENPRNRLRLQLGMLALLSCVGCGAVDDEDPAAKYRRGCLAARECDIRQSRCQSSWFEMTACVAEMEGIEQPSMRSQTLEDFEEEIRESIAEEAAEAEDWSLPLQLVGLLSPGRDLTEANIEQLVENVAAYYDTETKQVTVLERDPRTDSEDRTLVLAHEYVHALRDAESDLTELQMRWAKDQDSQLAITTLIESEAMVVSTAAYAASRRVELSVGRWRTFAADMLGELSSVLDEADEPLLAASQNLPYVLGISDMGSGWAAEGRAAIDALYDMPRLTVASWLEPSASPREPLDCHPTGAPDGFVAWGHERVGVVGLIAMRASARDRVLAALQDDNGWIDDSLVAFRREGSKGSASQAAAWRVRFSDASRASAFLASVRGAAPNARAQQSGADVIVYNATEPAVLSSWSRAADCGDAASLPESDSPGPIEAMKSLLRR